MSQDRYSVRKKMPATTKKKVLLLLLGGVALGLSRTPKQQYRIITGVAHEWRKLDTRNLKRTVDGLYKSKLVRERKNNDGTYTLVLTEHGKLRALHYNLETVQLRKSRTWDKKWRIVMYDVPEEERPFREDLFHRLKTLGFHELQHSVFAYPYECRDEIEYLIEFFDARPYIRFMEVTYLDDSAPLLKHFRLTRSKE